MYDIVVYMYMLKLLESIYLNDLNNIQDASLHFFKDKCVVFH